MKGSGSSPVPERGRLRKPILTGRIRRIPGEPSAALSRLGMVSIVVPTVDKYGGTCIKQIPSVLFEWANQIDL